MLNGSIAVPGDKSISHRALILAALAVGESRIEGLNAGADVAATIAALRAMGARIETQGGDAWSIHGVGVGGLLQPGAPFDLGNSGTSARLLMGLVASRAIQAEFTGDASLVRRPMDRLAAPLRAIGARIDGEMLPLTVEGHYPLVPARHRLDVPSAQVKSALLLAALGTPGVTELIEPVPTRDHLERLLTLFGAEIRIDGAHIALRGEAELKPQHIRIPGDASAAAFLAVAALIVPGS
ncbi:MAG TPA: 3-phosphoshikimate 1-carboxyvinyltransferase, partial [Allosphingosinicella sp.]|nr:3-phosphoshikimate 1-carboxyvinyltransferase [Allosphingosinicella sp.]